PHLFLSASPLHLRSLHSFPTRRSSDLVVCRLGGGGRRVGRPAPVLGRARGAPSCASPPPGGHGRPATSSASPIVNACAYRALPTDRKSTRLNSSHVSISYAVFCLKKKR